MSTRDCRLSAWAGIICLIAASSARAADDPKANALGLKAEYKNGFKLTTENGKFALRVSAGIQFRYTFMQYDHSVKGNEENYSNFFMRRARLWLEGSAFDPGFTYKFHLQLEPQSAVNTHEAWIAYRFSDLFTVGAGRNKIPHGTEFPASGFNDNFIDRSIFSGETDISNGGGFSRWPGSNAVFGTSNENSSTGFPVGGLNLFRSQGVSISGQKAGKNGAAFAYETGVWQGRDTRGSSNATDGMLYAVRLHFYPLGQLDWSSEGDVEFTETLKLGFFASAYHDSKQHRLDAAGLAVAPYGTTDSGHDLSFLVRYRGFSAALEWASERYGMDLAMPTNTFDRGGWRADFGYFVVRARIEVVGRYAQVQRLEDPTRDAAVVSGLGLVKVLDASGGYSDALEGALSEKTVGVNFYFGEGHQHKLFFDLSLLGRTFEPLAGFDPEDQEDKRFRSMLQFRF